MSIASNLKLIYSEQRLSGYIIIGANPSQAKPKKNTVTPALGRFSDWLWIKKRIVIIRKFLGYRATAYKPLNPRK